MGPDKNHLEEVKRDAVRTTLRHFRNEQLDNGYEPEVDLDTVEHELLGTHRGQPIEEGEITESAGPSMQELRDKAKTLGLSAGGSKADLQARIDAAESNPEEGE